MVRSSMVPRCAFIAWFQLKDKQRKILELRLKGMTQAAVARRLRIGQQAVSNTEARALRKLARKLGGRAVSIRELREWDVSTDEYLGDQGFSAKHNSYRTTAEVAWDHIVDEFLQGAASISDVERMAAEMA